MVFPKNQISERKEKGGQPDGQPPKSQLVACPRSSTGCVAVSFVLGREITDRNDPQRLCDHEPLRHARLRPRDVTTALGISRLGISAHVAAPVIIGGGSTALHRIETTRTRSHRLFSPCRLRR